MADRFDSIFRPGLFEGRVALVTGGGTGLGRCTAHELASLGAQVVIAGRRKEKLDQTISEIESFGGRCDGLSLDIRDAEAVERVVAEIVERHGRIDCLFNNAGGQFAGPTEKMSPNAWRTVIDLNLNGTFLVTRAVYLASMERHGGAVVSMLADIWTGYPWMAHMAAARAGIENLTRTLALEWSRAGVRINCVAPGTILSSGMLTYPREVQERTAKDADSIAAGRLGTESEVSAAVCFLLSPAAAYITGETIRIDGGAQFQKPRFVEVGGQPRFAPFHGFELRPDLSGTPFEKLRERKP